MGLYSKWERWGCIQAGVLLFQNCFLTGVVLGFEGGEVLFKSGVAFKRIRYLVSTTVHCRIRIFAQFPSSASHVFEELQDP